MLYIQVCAYTEICLHTLTAALSSHCLAGLQTRAGKMLSWTNHLCNTSDFQSGRRTCERKKRFSNEGSSLPCFAWAQEILLTSSLRNGRVTGTVAQRKMHHLWNESQHRAPTSLGVFFFRVPSPLGCTGRMSMKLAGNHLWHPHSLALLLCHSCLFLHQCLVGEEWKEFGERQ